MLKNATQLTYLGLAFLFFPLEVPSDLRSDLSLSFDSLSFLGLFKEGLNT